jgi:hypothetical protein
MAIRTFWYFTVEGTYPFPHDMLRYDACYPPNSEAAACDMASNRHKAGEKSRVHSVQLVTEQHEPTDGRWRSFGWKVTSVERRRY